MCTLVGLPVVHVYVSTGLARGGCSLGKRVLGNWQEELADTTVAARSLGRAVQGYMIRLVGS